MKRLLSLKNRLVNHDAIRLPMRLPKRGVLWMGRYTNLIVTLLFSLAVVVCSTAVRSAPSDTGVGYGFYANKDYIIGVNDSIQVSVWRNQDLSVAVSVRPDGKISAPLVGDVVAAGRTPMQLADDITKKLGTYIRNPQVSIIMAGLSSHEYLTRVRVTGAVVNPTSVTHQKGMTLLDLILDAGGVNDFAAANRTVVYRTDDKGVTRSIKVNLSDILKKGKLEDNITLQPGDVVTIPESFF